MTKRILNILTILLISLSVNAQGWVTDEASKDNSGGIFSGVLGFLLLIGLVWFIGYISDIISEDKDIRERNRKKKMTNDNTSYTPTPQSSQLADKNTESQKCKIPDNHCSSINRDIPYEGYKARYLLTQKPNTVTMYDGYKLISTLNGKNASEDVNINPKEGTKVICDSAFDDIENLSIHSIDLPNSLWVIGYKAFLNLTLSELTIPKSVWYITGNPFCNRCMNIISHSSSFSFEEGQLISREQSLLIADLSEESKIKQTPSDIKYIGRGAYQLQKSLELIIIGSSVVAIADSAFGGSLTCVIFQGKVDFIESTSFGTNLKAIYVPVNLKTHYNAVLPDELKGLIVEMNNQEITDEEILNQYVE